MKGTYLAVLIISLVGLATIDYRFKLAYFHDAKQVTKILLIALLTFVVWDLAGIFLGIFFIGSNNLLLGIRIGQFPLEEMFFLLLLSYSSLIVYLLIKRFGAKR